MEELIKDLRTVADENLANGQTEADADWGAQEGVLISNGKALEIARALQSVVYAQDLSGLKKALSEEFEKTKDYPPIVRMTLGFLEMAVIDADWFAIDRTGHAYEHSKKPFLHKVRNIWTCDGEDRRVVDFPIFRQKEYFNLLFQRTESGWIWAGKPE